MNHLFPQFLHFLESQSGLQPGNKVLLALSGGLDSMVLLQLLQRAHKDFPLQVCAAHVNYALRGAESEADAKFVQQRCAHAKIPCELLRWQENSTENPHDAMRQFRYTQFWQQLRAQSCHALLTAHHRDDQVETVLMHLLRGSGLKGLAGMQLREERSEGVLLRPLLSADKKVLLEYALSEKVAYREDSSNAEQNYHRNWLRHEIVARLQERYPACSAAITRCAEHARTDEQALHYYAGVSFEQVLQERSAEHLSFSLLRLRELPKAVRARIYLRAAAELGAAALYDDHVEHIDAFVISPNGERKTYRLPHGAHCVRLGAFIVFTTEGEKYGTSKT